MSWRGAVRMTGAGLVAALLAASCASPSATRRNEQEVKDGYYSSPYVRRCLQFEKEQMVSQGKACWDDLLLRIDEDPEFAEKAKLSSTDIDKIRQNARASGRRSRGLAREHEACLRVADRSRAQRVACLEKFLSAHGQELSLSERYEVQSAIAGLKEAEERAAGKQEATIEHAGKLLGMTLINEDRGVRIDKVIGPPASLVALREQGLVLQLAGLFCSEMEAAERVSRLESCEQSPLRILVRYGEMEPVEFVEAELGCGKSPSARQTRRVQLVAESCSEENSPELNLGLSWCYLAAEGVLEVEQVCVDSPAARAGLHPGQRIDSIGGESVMGKTPDEITALLRVFPAQSLELGTQGEALEKPLPLAGPTLDAVSRAACWRAILSARQAPGP